MGKYPIRLVGEPYVPRELDLDMEPPEWHTPWFEADALDADGHHHRVYWPIPNKTNEWLVGHLLTVDDPELACCVGDNYFDHSIRHLDHLYLYEAVNDTYFTATEDDRVISVMSEAQAKEWARDQLYPRDYDALCDGLWWCPV